jgi:glutathione S-transferase
MKGRRFVIGERPTIADISMIGYLLFPKEETGYAFAASHPGVHAWLGRVAGLPGWRDPYDLLPGKRLVLFSRP